MKHTKMIMAFLLTMMVTAGSVLALNPSKEYKQLPEKYNMVYDDISVTTADGAVLKGWYFPANVKTTELILLCHNGEGNMADYLRKVDQFRSIGYNTVIFDYRGFGGSSAFEIDNNMYLYPHFQDDVIAMIDHCRKSYVSTFHIYGWGMGAGLALGIGYNRPEIRSIIADTPFLSMEDLEKKFSTWDTPMEVPFAGYDKKYEPIYSFDLLPAKSLTKIMLIIADGDKLMKVDDMKKLQAKQKKLVTGFYTVVGSDGTDNFTFDKVAYFAAISKFLKG